MDLQTYADKKSILVIRNQSFLNNDNLVEEISVDFSSNDDDNNVVLYPKAILLVLKDSISLNLLGLILLMVK